jgi:hypothetical protein
MGLPVRPGVEESLRADPDQARADSWQGALAGASNKVLCEHHYLGELAVHPNPLPEGVGMLMPCEHQAITALAMVRRADQRCRAGASRWEMYSISIIDTVSQ